jgi:hypothetical protein
VGGFQDRDAAAAAAGAFAGPSSASRSSRANEAIGSEQASREATIVCFIHDGCSPDRVNRLYTMVAAGLWQPFRFLCLTNDTVGLRPEVSCHPIPETPLVEGTGGAWRLLSLFSPRIAPLLGDAALLLSPDILIVGALDAFFERPGDLIMIRDWYHPLSGIGNESVLRFHPARLTDAFEQYRSDPGAVTSRFRNAREYLSWYAGYFGALSFWPRSWCVSFRHDCVPAWPLNHFRAPRLPVGSRVVVFHGEPTISSAIAGGPMTHRTRAHLAAPWAGDGAQV